MWVSADPVKLRAVEWKQICTSGGGGSPKAMKGRRLTVKDNILIVLEFLETDIKMADLYHRHNINPSSLFKWKNVNI